MNRNLRISLLGLGSVAAVAAPVALAVSCGDDNGEVNSPNTFDVGLELAYAPYNFRVTTQQYNEILAESTMTTDTTPNNHLTPAEAQDYLEMIAPAGSMGYGGGIDVYVANRMAEAISTPENPQTVRLHKYEWDALIPSMTTRHEFDAIIAGMTETPERAEQVAFTDSYLNAENVVLSRTGTTLPTFENMKTSGKIAVQGGTLQEDIAVAKFGRDHVQSYDSAGLVEAAITQGTNTYAICEDVRANVAVKLQEGLVITDVEDVHFDANTSGNNIGLPKDTPADVIATFDAAIAGITQQDRTDMLENAGALAVWVGQA